VKMLVLSADPYMRGRMKAAAGALPGTPIRGFVGGKILASKHSNWAAGDLFGSSLPFVTVQVVDVARNNLWKLTGLIEEKDISHGIGALGMPGATVIAGLINTLRPKAGEVIYVNAAAGAVGGMVGQIAKHVFHCKVIGSAGGPEKCKLLLEEFGFDHAIDYKTTSNKEELVAKLLEAVPEGIDMYFENVGGFQFDAALSVLKKYGRVAVCGSISAYNDAAPALMSFQPMHLIYKQQRIEGILSASVLENPDTMQKFLQDMSSYIHTGAVKVKETNFQGVSSWPTAFRSLFVGSNTGKVVVYV